MVCETPKANHPHTSESLVAAWTFSGRRLWVTNEPDSDCFVLCVGERGWKETCLWTRSDSSFERSSYASTLQTSASGVSGLPLFWLKTWFWVALTSATFVRYRWTVHHDIGWPLAISLSSMFFIKLPFLTTNLNTMLFCHSASPTGPAETFLFKWLFAHGKRQPSRLMTRSSKHDTSVTRPWVILHLTMQPARLRVGELSCLAI